MAYRVPTMKIKTIKKVLQSKFNDWANSITDETLREQVKKNTIITGGCIASMLLKEEINDFDVYFRNKETAIAVAKHYVKQFHPPQTGIECPISVMVEDERVKIVIKSSGIASENGTNRAYQYFETPSNIEGQGGSFVGEVMQDPGAIEDTYQDTEKAALNTGDEPDKPKYRPIFMSTNAITLSNKVQLVIRFYGEPDDIHKNYDFVHVTNYFTSWDGKLVLRQEALESILAKELRYVGSKYPVCSVIRLRKFIARGWTINAGQILKMLMQVNELNLMDFKVLEDQLVGVDCAYFCELIGKLKEKDPEKINTAYLVEIIDRMF